MRILIALIFLALLSACSKKAVPIVERQTDDSVHVSEGIIFEDTTVTIPGDSVSIIGKVKDNSMPEVKVKSVRSTLTVRVDSGQVRATCECDSIRAELKTARHHLRIFQSKSTQEVITKPPVVIEKTPQLTRILAWIGAIAIVLLIIYLVIKLYLPKLP